jgi:cyclopropane fatty-acyl-phospholipid synthase-like methyltransferase
VVRETLDPSFAPRRCLDFGCGVGRVAIPLARRTGEVVGVDVSESMLAEARRNCEVQETRNVTLLPSDDALSALTGRFDFIHSFVVFQHSPRERGDAILEALLEHLSVGALHLRYATRVSTSTGSSTDSERAVTAPQ